MTVLVFVRVSLCVRLSVVGSVELIMMILLLRIRCGLMRWLVTVEVLRVVSVWVWPLVMCVGLLL